MIESRKSNYDEVFCGIEEPLDLKRASVEASRCFYCYDAPCIAACPTEIDIPSFIRKIGNHNVRGAAMDILSANIMGGTCARACPVETLCQKACVREKSEEKPVQIGALQRFATDSLMASGEQPFKRAKATGHRIAVVGAGPAGLSCAHRLATLGHEVTVFEAKPKAGGLNEYGLAPYKMTDDFAQRELAFILGVGGIQIEHAQRLGHEVTLEKLKKDFSAVFLGIGLGSTQRLDVPGEEASKGVVDAVTQIEIIRQERDLKAIPTGKNVVVIGGGNTAVDIAIQMKRLGAEFVTLVYRRGVEQMGATGYEQELAQKNGVLIRTWAKPVRISGATRVESVEFEATQLDAQGKLVGTGQTFSVKADQVFKAIGQKLVPPQLETARGKLLVSEKFETTMPGVFAGGDCVLGGEDLTVTAVQQGKLAALAIHERLTARTEGGARG